MKSVTSLKASFSIYLFTLITKISKLGQSVCCISNDFSISFVFHLQGSGGSPFIQTSHGHPGFNPTKVGKSAPVSITCTTIITLKILTGLLDMYTRYIYRYWQVSIC